MPCLLLPPRFDDDTVALWRAATALGWDVERPRGSNVPERLREGDVAVYGETFFCWMVAERLSLVLLEPPLDWLVTLPPELTRREVRAARLGEVDQTAGPLFIKSADEKLFKARVFGSAAEVPRDNVVTDALPVLVSEPVEWELEFRCFVREGEIAALSPYLRNGELAQAEDESWPATEQELSAARAFARRVLRDERVALPPAVVLDVGRLRGGEWAVVEANPAWASGLYGCDPSAVLRVLARAAVPLHRLTEADRRWIVERDNG